MCGIFGYIGKSNAAEIIIQGLKNLEYRGYDSAGMAVTNNKQIFHIKQIGKVEDLENIYQHLPKEKKLKYISHCGIGHTRWATHGKVTLENCHPHLSFDNAIAIVHNGTIENYIELKKFILCNGINVTGDTDSEIIAHLIALNYKNSLYNAVVKTITLLKGSFAFAVISKYNPNTIIVAKHNSPLVIGCNKEGCYISSDIPALNSICSDIYIMAENEIAKITNKKLMFYLNNKIIVKNPINVTAEKQENSYNGFSCFMDKEINDIPNAIINTYNDINNKKDLLYKISLSIEKSSRIIFVGCGTAFHAALASSYIYENHLKKACRSVLASEFLYSPPYIDNQTVCFFISQSGETADTLNALKYAKSQNALTIAITNVKNSSITFISDINVYINAGREIAVASTKAYNAQITAMLLILRFILRNDADFIDKSKKYSTITDIVLYIRQILSNKHTIKEIAKSLKQDENLFFIGRGLDYVTAREGALKLKEIAYIHCEALAAGELKHGTLALITKGVKIITIITNELIKDKMKLAIAETKARGAEIIAITPFEEFRDIVDKIVLLPMADYESMPIISIIPLQLLALYTCEKLGYFPDKPRNLAKSVTVE